MYNKRIIMPVPIKSTKHEKGVRETATILPKYAPKTQSLPIINKSY